jgi:Tfp pilus assembly protein PilF
MDEEEKKSRRSLEYFRKGYVLQMKGQLDKAAHYFRKSIQCKKSAEAYTFLGRIHSEKGFYGAAIDDCLKAIEVNPDFGNPYNDIGAYLIHLKRYDEAVGWLNMALNAPLYKKYCDSFFNLGYIYEVKGEWYKAAEYYERAIEENPAFTQAVTALERLKGRFN